MVLLEGVALFDETVTFYESLYQKKCKLRFTYDAARLQLAQVHCVLIIAGTPEARKPYETTKLTLIVDSINAANELLQQNGALILMD